jgi:hypothetical protein
VASHVQEYGRRRYVTDPAHMPASHRAHLEWTPSRLVRWGSTISADGAAVIERILAAKAHPEQGYRACLGIMSLVHPGMATSGWAPPAAGLWPSGRSATAR